MEDKIETGEYVRTVDGTIAIIEDEEFDLRYRYSDSSPFYRYFKNNELIIERIVKHSYNIKDLIKVGDYVNGYLVTAISDDGCIEIAIGDDSLESIVTKEKFESIKYEV